MILQATLYVLSARAIKAKEKLVPLYCEKRKTPNIAMK